MKTDLIDDFSVALGFAACAHRNQKRKYTGEPYVLHCKAVAELVAEYVDDSYAVVAAALHDTVEDCGITYDDLCLVFNETVAALVLEVTDVSKPEDGNREERKRIDREHVAKSSPLGATIKLADLIDNTSTIVRHDKGFARIYLAEKEMLLDVLAHGDADLYRRAKEVLRDAQLQLGIGEAA